MSAKTTQDLSQFRLLDASCRHRRRNPCDRALFLLRPRLFLLLEVHKINVDEAVDLPFARLQDFPISELTKLMAGAASYACFFKRLSNGRPRARQTLMAPTLRDDPALRLPACDEQNPRARLILSTDEGSNLTPWWWVLCCRGFEVTMLGHTGDARADESGMKGDNSSLRFERSVQIWLLFQPRFGN